MTLRPLGLRIFRAVLATALLAWPLFSVPNSALAISPDEVLKDPKLEARARAISAGLRCPKCQSESIDDSNAEIAKDLRLMVRERLQAGDTDDQVKNFLVARYGEFILLRPRFSGQTLLLWVTPFAVLLVGGTMLWRAMRQRVEGQTGQGGALDSAEESALKSLLAGASGSDFEKTKAK